MLFDRNGKRPRVHATAKIAASAHLVGDITIGQNCYVDHNVVIESAGPAIHIQDNTIILAGSVIRSVGGESRPAYRVDIGAGTLISPHCTLAGCRIGDYCYVATAAVVLQGARIGDHSRIGIGAIVHAKAELPPRSRVGMRNICVPTHDGVLTTADVEAARKAVEGADFFDTAFGVSETDQTSLHEQVTAKLLEEVHAWHDETI
jgi:carbonic anhydrase/acetyltransferase-like protein (isoleucine patch superfamily)